MKNARTPRKDYYPKPTIPRSNEKTTCQIRSPPLPLLPKSEVRYHTPFGIHNKHWGELKGWEAKPTMGDPIVHLWRIIQQCQTRVDMKSSFSFFFGHRHEWNHKVYLTHVSWAKVYCNMKNHILMLKCLASLLEAHYLSKWVASKYIYITHASALPTCRISLKDIVDLALLPQ
jgi:hypothetical protein